MAERLHVVPDELRRAAREHRETADRLNTAPSSHPEVMAALESLGPIFAELRDAGRDLLDQRRVCYEQQAAAHAEMADRLSHFADVWEHHEADSADRLRGVNGEES